jgi:signal transduction histidine kinase
LGLALVDRVAHAHGGEIEINSKPGEGTRVAILLPSTG